MESGKSHLQAHDFSRAAIDFRNAIQLTPNDAEPHYQLGLTYLQSGDGQAGARELMTAIRLNPGHAAAQIKVAELMASNQNPAVVKQGLDKAQEMLASSPDNVDALRTIAMAELRLDDSTSAVEHLQQALAASPQDLRSAQALAITKLRANDIAGAEAVLLQGAADAPRSPQHALVLGRFYELLGKSPDAEKQYRRALEIDPKFGPALAALGTLLYRNKNSDEADQLFRRAGALPDKQYRPMHALFLYQTGRKEAAVQEFEEQYNSDRRDREARTRLLTAYLKVGRAADAERVLDAVLKQNPRDAEASMQRGELRLMSGRLQEAQTDLTEAIHTQGDSPKAHLLLARLHQARGETQNQIRELLEVLRLNPASSEARMELAEAHMRGKNPKAALDALDQAPLRERMSIAYLLERNSVLFALGDDARLKESVEQSLAISQDPRLLYQDALVKLKAKDYLRARIQLEAVLKQQPQNWAAVQSLAGSYIEEKNKVKALQVAHDYAARTPNSAVGQQVLGSILFESGDPKNAAQAFARSQKLDPNWTSATLGLVQVALQEGKAEDAAALLGDIVRREPENVFALFTLAGVEESLGRLDAAVKDYSRVLELDPANIQTMNNLAYVLADSQLDPKRALALAQRAKELLPNSTAVDDTIGWAYYNNGLFSLSVNYLQRAAKAGTARRKSHLAMAYIKLGDRKEAAMLLQSALKQEPSSADARRGIQLLAQMR